MFSLFGETYFLIDYMPFFIILIVLYFVLFFYLG